ncbi:MAG TPA: serpin family protein [Niabella sp.]|nr:serpin family protein [Niabella sp.]HOZ96750.1 serpin family protein [Niabella sp.]HQW14773.1 serpin family protein [Niabella sp.]HQX19975.1 serpin family protein [Niabella sp.]HQX42329.1 serpin family protein [Niabella sp.]
MKHLLFIASLFLLTTLAQSCKKSNGDGEDKRLQSNIQNPIAVALPVANAFTDFSFSFFKTLQEEQPTTDNIFVSPLSLHIALGMLVNGAEAETKAEIMKALKSDHLSQNELNKAYQTLLEELPKADPLVKLAIANAIFYRNGFSVETPFLAAMKNTFNAKIEGLPFDQSSLTIINKWASDNTQGKIPKVLDEIDPDLLMLIMNALYFKGDWRSKFDKNVTKDQPFYFEGGGQKTVRMMNQKDTFRIASGAGFDALQMPYGNSQFTATFILPKEGKFISNILNDFTMENWMQLQNSLYVRSIEVQIPKFKLEQEFKLNNTLQKMGMVAAFKTNATFDGIGKIKPLFVGFVKQNTFAAVDEVGTEAAAVTTIGMVTTSLPVEPPQFICNKPFGIIISEKTSNTILFMGRIMNPTE